MSFNNNDPRITAFVFGELNERERAEFQAELDRSPELQRAVAETRQTLRTLSNELQQEPPLRMSADQRRRIAAQVVAEPSGNHELKPAPLAASLPASPDSRRNINAGVLAVVVAMALSLLVVIVGGGAMVFLYKARSSQVAAVQFQSARTTRAYAASAGAAAPQNAPYSHELDTVSDYSEMSEEKTTALSVSPLASDAAPVDRYAAAPAPAEDAGIALGLERESKRLNSLAEAVAFSDSLDGEGILLADRPDLGRGPGTAGDRFDMIVENDFRRVSDAPLSTFSIDVDTASYSKVRQYLMEHNTLPRPDAVRIEELINYFTYDYAPPTDDVPFAAHLEIADCPWKGEHRLVRIGIKGRVIENDKRPTSNLVFLLDVSGSMDEPNKLPLLKRGMKMLVDQLGENDRVAIVVYAGAAGLVLDSTLGDKKQVILDALERLHAGGSTNGGDGIRLAYQTALDHFIKGGVNRVILCTDGDFNVGTTGTDELVRMAETNAKTGVFLSVLGFGMGNHNDSMLEQISNKGNGNYAFVDTDNEARKVLVEQMSGTLVTIAKDVKIQVEFNPQQVAAYRLIGYENRILAAEDFNNDQKDAGEIGAGHTVTALYEIVPAGAKSDVAVPPVDDLRYQKKPDTNDKAANGEMLLLKMRYKQPDGDTSSLLEFPVTDKGNKFGQASGDFRFAAAVASFGMLLRDSKYKGNATLAGVQEIATDACRGDQSGYRAEFIQMVERAKQLRGQ